MTVARTIVLITAAALAGGWAVGDLDDDAARTLRERSVILDRIG